MPRSNFFSVGMPITCIMNEVSFYSSVNQVQVINSNVHSSNSQVGKSQYIIGQIQIIQQEGGKNPVWHAYIRSSGRFYMLRFISVDSGNLSQPELSLQLSDSHTQKKECNQISDIIMATFDLRMPHIFFTIGQACMPYMP